MSPWDSHYEIVADPGKFTRTNNPQPYGRHGRLLTNVFRARIGLCSSAACSSSGLADEIVLHAPRGCHPSRDLWEKIVPDHRRTSFFSDSCNSWLRRNLQDTVTDRSGSPWASIFVVGCWLVRKWRKLSVHDPAFYYWPPRGVEVVSRLAKSFGGNSLSTLKQLATTTKVWKLIGWVKLEPGWVKPNADGAADGNLSLAGAGGVIRDKVWQMVIWSYAS